jgi:hypothetical protein
MRNESAGENCNKDGLWQLVRLKSQQQELHKDSVQ